MVGGVKFDSQREYRRWVELCQMQRAGLIAGLCRQKRFKLRGLNGRVVCRYVADHVYVERGRLVVEDVKSEYTRRLPMYRLKRELMIDNYGHEIREIT